jgi:hypothetical protein
VTRAIDDRDLAPKRLGQRIRLQRPSSRARGYNGAGRFHRLQIEWVEINSFALACAERTFTSGRIRIHERTLELGFEHFLEFAPKQRFAAEKRDLKEIRRCFSQLASPRVGWERALPYGV